MARRGKKQIRGFLVVGLGTLGWQTATGLYRAGAHVLAVDRLQQVVNDIQEKVTKAVCLDATDVDALRSAGALELDHALISLPHHFDSAVLIAYSLHKEGFKEIFVRVETEHQAQAIRMVGATNVVFPERDTALQLVRSVMYPGLADQIALGEDFSVLEVPCPPQFGGESLAALNLRRKHHVTLLATKLPATAEHSERMNINPAPDEPLDAESHLVVVGSHKHLTQFRRWATEQTGAALSEREQQLESEPAGTEDEG